MSVGSDPIGTTFADSHVESMFYAADHGLPWYGGEENKGVRASATGATMAEALRLSGLDWTVSLGPVFGGDDHMPVPNKRAMVRSSDKRVLAIVGAKYVPVQNIEVFSFLDALVKDDIMRYETAGSLYDGEKVWVEAQMKEGWRIGGDLYQDYIVGANSHDGSSKARFYLTRVRVVCRNTLRMSLREADQIVEIAHRGDVQSKLEAAKEFLAITTESQQRMNEWLEKMQETKVDRYKAMSNLKEVLFGIEPGSKDEDIPERRLEAVELFKRIYSAEQDYMEGKFKDTAYPVVQALTGFADHAGLVRKRNDGTEAMHNFFVAAPKFVSTGLRVVEKMTKVLAPVS